MPFHVRDPETDTLVREFARTQGLGVTEAVKLAVTESLERRRDEVEQRLARMQAVIDRASKFPNTGPAADKAFYDWLNDEED